MGNILQADLIDKYVTPFFGFRSAKSEVASGKLPRISPLVRTCMAFLIVEGAKCGLFVGIKPYSLPAKTTYHSIS